MSAAKNNGGGEARERAALVTGPDGRARCGWAGSDPDYVRYHDDEWGRPVHSDTGFFEKICLEGFQAGLSWITILRRREAFREAFHGFDPERVAGMTDRDVDALMADARIIRNRGKILATIVNARATVDLDGGLADLIWSFAPPAAAARPTRFADLPAVTPESTALSAELRSRGYRYVGPTTMYALMQATGLVDDHFTGCWRVSES